MLKKAQVSILYKTYSGIFHMIYFALYFLLNYIHSESFKLFAINAYKKNITENNK